MKLPRDIGGEDLADLLSKYGLRGQPPDGKPSPIEVVHW